MNGRAPAALAAFALLAFVLAAPAGALPDGPAWPGLPALPFPHLRDGNNTTGNETDTTPPTLAITSHRDLETVKETGTTLRGTAADQSGVRSVEVSLNGGSWAAASGSLSWSRPVRLEPGRNTISVRATDLAGNVAQHNISIVLDTSTRDNTGILLAAAVVVPIIALIVLFTTRRKIAPAEETPEEHDGLEKRLGLEGKERDPSGAELGDSEEVTRLDEAPARKAGGKARR